jgi:hypothetical protein
VLANPFNGFHQALIDIGVIDIFHISAVQRAHWSDEQRHLRYGLSHQQLVKPSPNPGKI